MDTHRIAELLVPFLEANDQRLTTNDCIYKHISTYIDILLRWNARINLTAIRDPEEIVTHHFGESLFAASRLFPLPSSVPPVPSVVKALDSIDDTGQNSEESKSHKDVANEKPEQRPATDDPTTLADL